METTKNTDGLLKEKYSGFKKMAGVKKVCPKCKKPMSKCTC